MAEHYSSFIWKLLERERGLLVTQTANSGFNSSRSIVIVLRVN